MEKTNMLKLFEEVENIEKNEGVEALTNEKICELCEKYNISMTELKNLVIEILSAGEITGFSDNEKSLENVAGGKMILKKGTATLLAALSTTSPFADTFAANPSRKITSSRDVCVVSHKKSTAQKENLKNPAIKALDFTKKIFAEYIPQKQEDAIKYTQKKFRKTHEKAKLAVLAAEAIAATSLIATTGLISHQMIKGNNRNNVIKISSTIGKRQLLEIVTPHKNVIIVHHEPKSDHCRILFLNDEDRIVSNALVSIGDVKNCRNSEKPYFYLSNRNYIRETAFALVNESGYNYFLDKLKEQKGITVLELENIDDEVDHLFSFRNDQYLKEFKKAISDFKRKQRRTGTTENGENQEGVTEGVNELESVSGKQLLQDNVEKWNDDDDGHDNDDDDDEKDEIESSGNLIKIPSIGKTDELLEEVKKRKNVIIVYRPPRCDNYYMFFPDDEDGVASEAFNSFITSHSIDVTVELSLRHGRSRIAMREHTYNKSFLDYIKGKKDITVLELKHIEGKVEKLMCGSYFNSGSKEFIKEVLNYREEQRREKQRTESSGDSEEQEKVTEEVAEGVTKLKSLRKKEDLLKIVKRHKKVVIVHRKENQEGSGPIVCDVFPLCREEREIVRTALSIYDYVEDYFFTEINYESFLNRLKAQQDIAILELENIGDEIEYLLKPGYYGCLRREDFAAASVVSAKKEKTKPITAQPLSPDVSASSSSSSSSGSSTMTEQQESGGLWSWFFSGIRGN